MRRGEFRLAMANEFTPHCLALASVIGVMLVILVFAFFIVPMLIIVFVPNPLLINDYTSKNPNVISLIISLAILGVLALICAKL